MLVEIFQDGKVNVPCVCEAVSSSAKDIHLLDDDWLGFQSYEQPFFILYFDAVGKA
jgi:hypothetical protein